jgi:methylase of polypeptide subunit release factors
VATDSSAVERAGWVHALRADLDAARYTVDTLTSFWGAEADAALFRGQRMPALRALEGRAEPAATLARLFVLGLEVSRSELDAALPTLGSAGAESLGLVTITADAAVPKLDLRPYGFIDAHGAGGFVLASDLGELALGRAIPESHVLGVGGASRTLAGLTVRNEVDSVLDLGTGCGIQALHAARHSRRIVATDISARALELARLNAELAGIDSIELRDGSLFEPVAGERFALIVSNPPFVITPRAEGVPSYEYRDGGLVGDALVASVVRGVGDHLEPGGIAQLLGNWEYRDGADGLQGDGLSRAAAWADDTGLDAWIIEREAQSVEEYAETWIRDGGTRPGTPEFDALYTAWLDDFDERGVTRIGFGYITLRRPASGAASLRRLERLTGALGTESLGSHIAASLAAHDWLAEHSDSLADARLTLAGDVTEERHYWPGDEHPTVMTLRQGGGFARSVSLDTGLAAVVGACDGDLPLGAIVGAVAQLTEVDATALFDDVLPSIRELVFTGMLLPE